MRNLIRYNTKFGQTARCACNRPTGRQHHGHICYARELPLNRVGDGKLTSVTVLRGCRPRLSLVASVSLPNISLERTRKARRSTLTLCRFIVYNHSAKQ
jgi:hypothetical protein